MATVNPIIGYHNLLNVPGGVVTAEPVGNPPAAGFPIANVHNWLDHDFWKATTVGVDAGFKVTFSTAKTADYFAFAAHDLFTQSATIKLDYWNGTAWVNAVAAFGPADNGVRFKTFTSASSTIWRVTVSGAPILAASIGVLSFGNRLTIPSPVGLGFTPPNFAYADQILNNVADGGALLGRSVIGKGIEMDSVSFDLLDPAWMRTNWIPFMAHANQYPFFFQWNDTGFNAEAAFCWTKGPISRPAYNQPKFMSAKLDLVGRRD